MRNLKTLIIIFLSISITFIFNAQTQILSKDDKELGSGENEIIDNKIPITRFHKLNSPMILSANPILQARQFICTNLSNQDPQLNLQATGSIFKNNGDKSSMAILPGIPPDLNGLTPEEHNQLKKLKGGIVIVLSFFLDLFSNEESDSDIDPYMQFKHDGAFYFMPNSTWAYNGQPYEIKKFDPHTPSACFSSIGNHTILWGTEGGVISMAPRKFRSLVKSQLSSIDYSFNNFKTEQIAYDELIRYKLRMRELNPEDTENISNMLNDKQLDINHGILRKIEIPKASINYTIGTDGKFYVNSAQGEVIYSQAKFNRSISSKKDIERQIEKDLKDFNKLFKKNKGEKIKGSLEARNNHLFIRLPDNVPVYLTSFEATRILMFLRERQEKEDPNMMKPGESDKNNPGSLKIEDHFGYLIGNINGPSYIYLNLSDLNADIVEGLNLGGGDYILSWDKEPIYLDYLNTESDN